MSKIVYEVYCQFIDLGGIELIDTFNNEDDANDFVDLQESLTNNSYFVEAVDVDVDVD